MKNGRQEQIIKIIAEGTVETQEDLIKRLREDGFQATQATVSRDIKELKIVKISSENGHYKYVFKSNEDPSLTAKYDNVLREAAHTVRSGGTTVVVRTYTGLAMAAATAIDQMHMEGMIGTIAGDDTIFIAASDEKNCKIIEQRIKQLIKEREE